MEGIKKINNICVRFTCDHVVCSYVFVLYHLRLYTKYVYIRKLQWTDTVINTTADVMVFRCC